MELTPEQRRAKEHAKAQRRWQRLKADPERHAAHKEYMNAYNRAYRAAKRAARMAEKEARLCK